jgi:hypothetical protein
MMTRGMSMILAIAGIAITPLGAQVRTVDPNAAGDMAATTPAAAPPAEAGPSADTPPAPRDAPPPPAEAPPTPRSQAELKARAVAANDTYAEKDVLDAAEGVFGKGAAGLAEIVEKIFKKQGRPTAYIAGREAGGAFVVGVRYGSGTMFHKVEGERKVYWTGPSIGFDAGANGAKTFVLVYNLYDTQDLYKRFPAAEGNAYVVGGFTASYLRRGDIVVIPIRLGVGLRLGVNAGYMHFSEKSRWSPL